MAYGQPAAWYIHAGDGVSTGYYAITAFIPSTPYVAGQLVRPSASASPAVAIGNERVYVCIVAGTSGGTEPVWTFTKGAIQPITGTVTFQECTAESALNGDLSNILLWTSASNPPIGRVIYDPTSGSIQICNVSNGNGGATNGNKPVFSATAGVVTNDVNNRWTSLGLATAWTAWKAPSPRLSIAATNTWGGAGNDFYVADNSAETSTAAITLNVGSTAAPSRVFSVDHTNATMPPPASALKAGASITGSGTVGNSLVVGGSSNQTAYWFGVNFIVNGNGAAALMTIGNGQAVRIRFEQCVFTNLSANAGASINFGPATTASGAFEYVNCALSFNLSGQFVSFALGSHAWRANAANAILGAAAPASMIRGGSGGPPSVVFEGMDFTALGANALFINLGAAGLYTLKNCKLHASTVLYTAGGLNVNMVTHSVDLINTDSGTNVLRNERHNLYGDETTVTTVYRAGGATEGGVAISHLIAAASSSRLFFPFPGLPLVIWNDVIGVPRTLTIYGCSDTVSTPALNNWIWLDVEYMGSSATPLGSFVSTGLSSQLDVQVAYPADTSAWTGGINAGSRFSMSATFTAQQKGNVYIYPRATSSGPRFYLDPLPVLA